MMLQSILTVGLAGLLFAAAGHAFAGVTLTPVPDGETPSTAYGVSVNRTPLGLYAAKNKHTGDYAFGSFTFDSPATVTVTGPDELEHAVIRPETKAVQVQREKGKLTLRLDAPCKLSIEPNGTQSPLLLFAEPPEAKPITAAAPNVIYFGPGVHKPGKITLQSNQTLYLAAGAVVKGAIEADNVTNVRIAGRGILCGDDWPWLKGPARHFLDIRNGSDLTIEDITMRGAFHWNLVLFQTKNVTIRNIKILNGRVENDDAIDLCNVQDVTIKDCFIRSDDDCVAIKGMLWDKTNPHQPIQNVSITNTSFWCDRARIFLLGHESVAPAMENITVRNCDILHYVMTPFLLEPGEEMPLRNITFDNIRVNADGKKKDFIGVHPTVNEYMKLKQPGHVKGIVFRDISLTGNLQPDGARVTLHGPDETHAVDDVLFDRVSVQGKTLSAESPEVKVGANASNVRFQ